jgi:predicted cupin superfamily sugar epimerase
MSAKDMVRLLDLKPHPEGGYFRETFRDAEERDGRPNSTAIYYLLGSGDRSRWHRIDAVEVWHFYAGAPLELRLSFDGSEADIYRLGPDFAAGGRPQLVVPRDCWQTAVSLGDWTLTGCTVAPGFDFAGFELAPPDFEPPLSPGVARTSPSTPAPRRRR